MTITAAPASVSAAATLMPELLPLAAVALIFWALAKWGRAPLWALILALILGVVVSGTIAGPPIQQFLSQFSGGYLH